MSHYLRSGTETRPTGALELLGILAAVIPCGVLAGLYFATGDGHFLIVCLGLLALAVAIIFLRNIGKLRLKRQGGRDAPAAAVSAGRKKLGAVAASLRRPFTVRILKLLGISLWLLAWAALASFYARVVETPNMLGLVMLVIVGGFSPILIYFGLESGVRRLSRRDPAHHALHDE